MCRKQRRAALSVLHELFADATPALITFPELDHYGARKADYLGPIHAQLNGAKINWPQGTGKYIFAYLRPDVPGFQALIKRLQAQTNPTILIAPNAPQAWVAQHASQKLAIYTSPIQIDPLLKHCELGISYGGSGTLSQFALAGVPQLILPKNIEQYLGGMRVQEMGAGLVVGQERGEAALQQQLDQVLNDTAQAKASHAFKTRHANFRVEQAIERVAGLLEQQQPSPSLTHESDSPLGPRIVH